jgi:anti-sigma factor RsiW
MNCPQSDYRILDYLENQLPVDDSARMAIHLAGCPDCRMLAEQLQQLDHSLANALIRPELSAGFTSRLKKRLAQEARLLPELERAARKRQLQAEFDEAIEKLNQQFRGLGSLQHVPGCALVAGFGGVITWCLARSVLEPHIAGGLGQWLSLLWAATAGLLLAGFVVAFPRQFKRFWVPG